MNDAAGVPVSGPRNHMNRLLLIHLCEDCMNYAVVASKDHREIESSLAFCMHEDALRLIGYDWHELIPDWCPLPVAPDTEKK